MLRYLFPALGEAQLRRYLLEQITSVVGRWVQNVTLNLVTYEISKSGAVLAVLNFLLYGPQLLISAWVGLKITAGNAKWIMLSIIALSSLLTASLCAWHLFYGLTLRVILFFALPIGIVSAVELCARQVLLVSCIADRSLIGKAVATNVIVYNSGRAIGPLIAALCYTQIGPALGFFLYGLSLCLTFAWVHGVLVFHDNALTPQTSAKSCWHETLRYCGHNVEATRHLLTLTCLGLFMGGYQTLIPLVSDRIFHNTAQFTGIFFGCAGVGSLGAAMLLSSVWGQQASARWIRLAPWAVTTALAALVAVDGAILSAGAFLVIGFNFTFCAVVTNATLQMHCPDSLRGALAGIYGVASGTLPYGGLLAGAFLESLTIGQTFGVLALLLGCSTAAIALTSSVLSAKRTSG